MTPAPARPSELASFLSEERTRVNAALEDALERLTALLPKSLRDPVADGVLLGGKRVRPVLCVAAYRACFRDGGGEPHSSGGVYDLAIGVELIHAYSLMHDDLPCMDDAPLRRGRPTPHTMHGEERTMLAGAALIPLAALQVWRAADELGIEAARRRHIVRILCEAAGEAGMVGGQALDLLGEGRTLGRRQLDTLHGMKTGALLTGSLLIGGVAAGASDRETRALESYGRSLGLAFQIADDVLDATATAETLGKAPSDEALAKSTYVSLLGVEAARMEAERQVEQAVAALRDGGLESFALEALAGYVVSRDR